MNADFLAVLEFWEREKGISRDVLVQAVEEALLSAAKKAVGPARELRCAIDTKTGDIKAFAKLVVRRRSLQTRPDFRFRRPPHQGGRRNWARSWKWK
jgi:transcription termination/antitermination protein NusA